MDSIGVSFLKMISNNLKSEFPFCSETNKIILNYTKCANFPTLFIKSKNVFRKLGHRGGEDEIPYKVITTVRNQGYKLIHEQGNK